MCPGCGPVWTCLHALWSGIYVTCGAAQLIAGIFFLISIPQLHLICNLWAGTWNVVVGIAAGMLACFGQLSSRRQEFLLYMAVSILIVNVINAILAEWGFYSADMPKILAEHPYHTLITYACLATRAATAVIITVSFLDSQISFCSMQMAPKPAKNKSRGSHEQVSDIEYIIPRPKPATKSHTVYNAYTQSWVFEADTVTQPNNNASPYMQLKHESPSVKKPKSPLLNDTAHLIDNPVVHIEEASDDSNSNSDRKLCYMKSFSRSTSPVLISACSSQLSLNGGNTNNPPIYECLEKLTDPTIYRSRLNSSLSNKDEDRRTAVRRIEPSSPNSENVQYASVMRELQRAIVGKKEASIASPPLTGSASTDSKSGSRHESAKSSDAEFSKELEAALQLIQDLESPNTVETPSEVGKEGRPLGTWRNSDASESEKTLSAVGSLAEISSPLAECQPELCTFRPSTNGKGASVIIHYTDSRSTSGYSSPTHPGDVHWSTASSVSDSNNELSCSIYNGKTAVISLYPQGCNPKSKSVSLVTITGNEFRREDPLHNSTLNDSYNNYFHRNLESRVVECDTKERSRRRCSQGSAAVWNVKSLLRRKRNNPPKLSPELEGAIVKSESLAYLTKLELLARHQRNSDIQRQIEERVLQQLGVPKVESNC